MMANVDNENMRKREQKGDNGKYKENLRVIHRLMWITRFYCG